MAENRHPGINMHKMPVGGGWMGILFAVGCSLIFVLGFPTLWYFVALTFALGIGIAIFMRIVTRYRSERNRPLSILETRPSVQPAPKSETPRNRFHSNPLLAS